MPSLDPQLTLRLLGPPRLERDAKPVEFDTRKVLALLAYLAVSGAEGQARETLAALLWPEHDSAHAQSDLRHALFSLRKGLGEDAVAADRRNVKLSAEAVWVDVLEFRRRTRPDASLEALDEAVALWRDGFMSGFNLRDSEPFDEWQRAQAGQLTREYADALERLSRAHAERGEHTSAISHARRWLALDPLCEEAHRCLMALYARAGKRDEALRQYEQCRRTLEAELGVPPLEETAQLFERIKARRMAPPLPASPESTAPAQSARAAGAEALVGRERDWAILYQAFSAHQEEGHFFVLEGEAGIGKTRLAEAFAAHARSAGVTTLLARCYEGEAHLAYSPFADAIRNALDNHACLERILQLPAHWLTESARLLPELGRGEAMAPDGATPALLLSSPTGAGAQPLFFEGLRRVLMQLPGDAGPLLLVLDDAQWADAASLDLLAYLVRRLRGARLFILATWRPEDVPHSHRLRLLFLEAQRTGLAGLHTLNRWTKDDIGELLSARSAPPPLTALTPARLATLTRRLFSETEGVPLLVTAYLAEMQRNPAMPDATSWQLPAGVQGLLRARLASVGEIGRQVLQAAAIIGRKFDFDVVERTSGRSSDETAQALELAMTRDLIREVRPDGAPVYDFTHDKLRALTYDDLSLARRRLLHARVAAALQDQVGKRSPGGELAGQIAHHLQQAGENAAAARYMMLAGEHAQRLYANVEALAYFQSALDCGCDDKRAVHEALGDLHTLSGDYGAALQHYEAAQDESETDVAPDHAARIAHKLANVYDRCGNWESAEAHFLRADKLARKLKGNARLAMRARVLADWGRTLHRHGDHAGALVLTQEALQLAGRAADLSAQAQSHNMLGMLARNNGDLPVARQHLQHSLDIAQQLNYLDARVAALNNLALVLHESGETGEAIDLTRQALDLCHTYGDRHREAALHNNLADLYHAYDRVEDSMDHLKQAVQLFAQISNGAGELRSQIWQLTEW
jgi:DNA-binding SARP family transcriptional activator